jgi:purine-binding chemotaxis protein CheW
MSGNEETITSTGGQFATFYVGKMLFGVDVQKVQEIIRYQSMTPVPLSSPVVQGLINLRGQIITAIDLRRRLGMPDREGERMPMNVVVRTDDGVVSLLVDEIGDVLEVEGRSFEPTPNTIQPEHRELISGVYKLNGALLLVLNAGRAVDVGAVH